MNTINVVGTFLFVRHLAYGVMPSTYFCRPSRFLHLFPTECKIRSSDFYFLCLHRPAKFTWSRIYVSRVLRKSGSYCIKIQLNTRVIQTKPGKVTQSDILQKQIQYNSTNLQCSPLPRSTHLLQRSTKAQIPRQRTSFGSRTSQ